MHDSIWSKLIMKWSGSRIGGGIGAYCLLQLIVALSLDKLFFIGPNKGFKDHSGVGIGIQCGWSMYHQDDGYSMPYEDALSGKGWHTPEISGMLWLAFMLLAIFTAFCAVQISLTPALSNRKFSAMMLFIISGLSAIIGGATAHLDNHHPGHYNACIELGNGSVSLYLAFSHAFGLLLAARFLYLDLKQMTQPVIYAINERPEKSGQGVYNMETIELGDETAPSEIVLEEDVNLEMVDGRIKMTKEHIDSIPKQRTLTMPWLRMQMGGGIGAYCLFMLVLAMSVDELFYISPIHGFKDKNGMSIGIHCGSVMFHRDDGYSMLYADAPSGKGWHAAEIAGILWDLFMISSIVTSFVAVQISLTPALRNRRKGAMNLFIIGGLCAIIGASCAHADNAEDGRYNVCVEKGRAGSSVFLAFLHGFFLLLAAIFLWLDESEIEPSAQRRAEQSTGAVPRGGEAAYNMETIELPEEATPELQLAEPKDEDKVIVEQPTLR